ncbi:hypothetical protein [Methanofollis fontis]|uniref:Uncharacterized protein n=1 Tax=Methanofollis fontis TaxID=2052832 RepID=A0A483CV98_9EURY|nr:hypothetical protein [Methanofollis fontis]TAJ45417.1 hypothetical protein CUJ86_01375 [Methanofollis fontis]
MNHHHAILCLLIVAAVCSAPAGAVILEVTVTGVVEEVRPSENLIVASADATVGQEYGNETVRTVYEPLEPTVMIECAPPDPAALGVISAGDAVALTLLGGMNGPCIAIGKLQETASGDPVITDLVGDPAAMPVPLVGEYALTYEAEPDCANATGTVAPALSVNVSLYAEGMEVFEKTLLPGESFTWNGRNDGSAVNVTFIGGEASSASCPGSEGIVGPQAVATFIVAVTPPIGSDLTVPETTATPTAAPGLLALSGVAALAGAVLLLRRG